METSLTRVTRDQRDLKVVEVTSRFVACDGGCGALGHPLTYYEVGSDGTATCNYCDKKFILAQATGEVQG